MEQSRISIDVSVSPDEAIALLRSTPLLQQIPEDTLRKLYETLQPVRYGPGEPIVRMNSEGAGLYILWRGEAKVKSPPNGYPFAHKESILRRGDYFGLGIMGPVRPKYTVDVVAITEVICLVLYRERADLLAGTSVWNVDSQLERPSKFEMMLQLETVGVNSIPILSDMQQTTVLEGLYGGPGSQEQAVGDLKMKGSGLPNYYAPFMQGTRPFGIRVPVGRNIFGGQLVAQALRAATKTMNPELLVHSLHSYFVQAANVKFSVLYEVEKIRDGKSFATRHVKATQNDKVVFVLYASFKTEGEGFEHAASMPSVPAPEELISMDQVFDEFTIDPRLPLDRKKTYPRSKFDVVPIDVRYVNPVDKFQPVKIEPRKQMWIRSRFKISEGQNFHRCVVAYATDLHFLETSLRPHPETLGAPIQVLSLDHTIWFHRSFDSADWLLFVIESPVAANGLGLSWGKLYTRDGKLVMSVAQEGVIRLIEDRRQGVAKL